MKKLITLAALATLPLALAACSGTKTEETKDWSAASSAMSESTMDASSSDMSQDDTSAAMEQTKDEASSTETKAVDGARD